MPGVARPVYRFDEFEVDANLFEIRRAGHRIEVSPRAFDVLTYLIRHRERMVSQAELVSEVWKARAVAPSAVPTAVREVRKALDDRAKAPRFVQTSYRRGYRFLAEVEVSLGSGALAGSESDRPAFVGRRQELAALGEALARAQEGEPQVVLVRGEPGIGKTRLCEEFAAIAASRGGSRVVFGRSSEVEGAPVFWPWVQLLQAFAEEGSSEIVDRVLGPNASVLADMVPEIGTAVPMAEAAPRVAPEQARFRLFEAVARTLERAAGDQSLVVVLDDLHRADADSLALFQYVARELRDAAVLVLGAFREGEGQANSRLALPRDAGLSLELKGFSRQHVAAFLANTTREAPPGLAGWLHERSGGNPFFLVQLVRILEAEGPFDPSHEPTSLPEGIRAAVLRRLESLPDASRRLVSGASVIGREFEASLLCHALGWSPEAFLQAASPVLASRIFEELEGPPGGYRFSHVLVREAIYEEIDTLERARLHRGVAEGLEEAYASHREPHAAALAHHWAEAAVVAGGERAIHYCIRAGRWATARLAYDDAPVHFREALRLGEAHGPLEPLARAELRLELGEAEIRAGQRDSGEATLHEVIREAEALGEPVLAARAALAVAPGFFAIEFGVIDLPLIELLEKAMADLGEREPELRARLLARLALALNNSDEVERTARLSREAVRLAEQLGDEAALAHALQARHAVLAGPENAPDRLRLATEIVRTASRVGDRELELVLRLFRLTDRLELGDMRGVDREIDAFTRLATDLRQRSALWYTKLFPAMRAIMKGRFEEGERLADQYIIDGSRVGDRNAILSYAVQKAFIRGEQGRIDEIVDDVERMIEAFPPLEAAWRSALAWGFAEQGGMDEMLRQFDAIVSEDFRHVPRNAMWLMSMTFLATPCRVLGGDDRRTRILYNELLPFASRFAVVGYSVLCLGSVARSLGVLATALGAWEEAEEHFKLALFENRRIGAMPWFARTLKEYADMLQLRGAPASEVRSYRDRALRVARRLDLKLLLPALSGE